MLGDQSANCAAARSAACIASRYSDSVDVPRRLGDAVLDLVERAASLVVPLANANCRLPRFGNLRLWAPAVDFANDFQVGNAHIALALRRVGASLACIGVRHQTTPLIGPAVWQPFAAFGFASLLRVELLPGIVGQLPFHRRRGGPPLEIRFTTAEQQHQYPGETVHQSSSRSKPKANATASGVVIIRSKPANVACPTMFAYPFL